MGIGVRITQLRKQAGMTQPDLADRVGVHETTIRRWEQEKDKGPDTAMVLKLAESLGTTVEQLLSEPKETSKVEPKQEKTLVYDWGGTNRLALPNTPETRELFERLVIAMSGKALATA